MHQTRVTQDTHQTTTYTYTEKKAKKNPRYGESFQINHGKFAGEKTASGLYHFLSIAKKTKIFSA